MYLFVLASTTQCVRESGKRITNGTYREPSGIEAITVNGENIEFQIRMPKGRREGEVVNRKYDYKLLTDGSIHVGASSNDEVVVAGIDSYDWFWDGRNIIRKGYEWFLDEKDLYQKRLKSGGTVIFAPETAVAR